MLFDLFYELSSVRIQFPIRLGKVTKFVSDGWLKETAGAAHVWSAKNANLNG